MPKAIIKGHLIGEVAGIKAHLACRGLLLNGGNIHAIPELEVYMDGVEMPHEAAVGIIAQEEIACLMSRGPATQSNTRSSGSFLISRVGIQDNKVSWLR